MKHVSFCLTDEQAADLERIKAEHPLTKLGLRLSNTAVLRECLCEGTKCMLGEATQGDQQETSAGVEKIVDGVISDVDALVRSLYARLGVEAKPIDVPAKKAGKRKRSAFAY